MIKKVAVKLVFAALLLLTASLLVVAKTRNSPKNYNINNRTINDTEQQDDRKSTGTQNFLILGIDDAANNSDVIMIVNIDFDTSQVNLLQIPRDTYVNKYNKINTVYASAYNRSVKNNDSKSKAKTAAAEELCSFLSLNMQIELDNYICVTTDGLRKIVNSVGGVEITLPQSLDYDDDEQNLHIHLPSGTSVLNGSQAEWLVRCRSEYLTADYGRMDAQKLFLTALFKKIRYDLSVIEYTSLLFSLYGNVTTSLSLQEILSLADCVGGVTLSDIRMVSAKGISFNVNGMLCEVMSKQTIHEMSLLLGGTADYDKFDKNTVFTDISNASLHKIYLSTPVYGLDGVSAEEIDKYGIQIK